MSADETIGPPQIPGLVFRDLLGSGGFAHVYRYQQTALGRDVAVKVIHGFDEAARRHFASEATLMARLSSHPHVVPVYQVGVSDDDRPYLVMQLCPPPHLGDRLRAQPLPVAEVLQIGIQVAGAVETAHRLGILHRDIKPANIMFSEYGRPLLSDFGIAQSLDATAQPLPAFSPAWAPPEQAIGQGFAPTTDVYSLSATLWAALTGRAPLGPVRADATARALGREDVPTALEDVLRQGLAEEPERRPATVLALARSLQQVQAQQGLPVTPIELWRGQGGAADTDRTPDDRTRLVTLVEPSPGLQLQAEPGPEQPLRYEPLTAPQLLAPPLAQHPVRPPAASPVWQPDNRHEGRRRAIAVLSVLLLLALLAWVGAILLRGLGADDPSPGAPTATQSFPASARSSAPAVQPASEPTTSTRPATGTSSATPVPQATEAPTAQARATESEGAAIEQGGWGG